METTAPEMYVVQSAQHEDHSNRCVALVDSANNRATITIFGAKAVNATAYQILYYSDTSDTYAHIYTSKYIA